MRKPEIGTRGQNRGGIGTPPPGDFGLPPLAGCGGRLQKCAGSCIANVKKGDSSPFPHAQQIARNWLWSNCKRNMQGSSKAALLN